MDVAGLIVSISVLIVGLFCNGPGAHNRRQPYVVISLNFILTHWYSSLSGKKIKWWSEMGL